MVDARNMSRIVEAADWPATPHQVLWKLRWPASIIYRFTSQKVAMSISLVGAIVADLPTGAEAGIGARLLSGSYRIPVPFLLPSTDRHLRIAILRRAFEAPHYLNIKHHRRTTSSFSLPNRLNFDAGPADASWMWRCAP